MPMLSETYMGKYYEGDQVFSAWTRSIPGQDNDSYVILGESGYGKSVAAQSIMLQKAYQGHRILDLNIHNATSSEHIFPIFRKAFEQLSSRTDVYITPISTTLFNPLRYADGTTESSADLSYTLSNIITKYIKLSRTETAAFSDSLEYVISNLDDNPDIFPAILKTLDEFDTKASRSASAHLAPLLRHNVFRNQPIKRHSGIEIINLSKFPPLFQKVIADLLLFDEFRTASQGGQPPRYIHIDAAGVFSAASSIIDSISLFNEDQNCAAFLSLTSGISGGGATVLSLYGISGGAIIALVSISFVSAILAELIQKNDLQLLLENCAYGEKTKIKSKSGIELLQTSRKKCLQVKSNRLKYIHCQQWVLNQLTTLDQGIISAHLRFYFEYNPRPVGGNQVVFESTFLDYITISLHLLNMPLVQGKADFNIIHFDKEGNSTNLSDYLDVFEDNVTVDAEKGLVIAKFNIKKEYKTNYRKYFTKDGQIKVMVRTTHTMMNGKSINTPADINGDEQCASFYFSCNNTCDFTQVHSNGLTTYFADSNPPLENSRLFYKQILIKSEVENWVK